jgi:branched-chain amino acid transport system ATP-binding protein
MSAPLLLVSNWSVGYGAAEVVFGVNLSLQRGEAVALLGRNGAGKSTLLKSLMHLIAHRGGRMAFQGEDTAGLAPHDLARRGVGYVAQERRIFADLTVAENLDIGRQPPRTWSDGSVASAWTVEDMYRLFPNLRASAERAAGLLSGGEQKMLALARTLLGNPLLLLLDEPAEGVAPIILEALARAVRAAQAQGVSVLLAEQNLEFATTLCTRALLLEQGSVVHDGPLRRGASDQLLRTRLGF